MKQDGRLSGYQAKQHPQRGPCTLSSRQVRALHLRTRPPNCQDSHRAVLDVWMATRTWSHEVVYP